MNEYKYEEAIANGRYGKIYLATNKTTKETFAIKKVDLISLPRLDKILVQNEVPKMI